MSSIHHPAGFVGIKAWVPFLFKLFWNNQAGFGSVDVDASPDDDEQLLSNVLQEPEQAHKIWFPLNVHHVATQKMHEVKLRRLLGSWMPSKLWLNSPRNVKPCRLLGNWMPSKLWLNRWSNVKLCRLLGNWMPSKLRLNS